MLSPGAATRVLVAITPVDLRGSFNRLYGLVSEQLKADPLSGHLFVFTNRQRQQTTFTIPIRYGTHCVPLASTLRTAVISSPTKRKKRHRGH